MPRTRSPLTAHVRAIHHALTAIQRSLRRLVVIPDVEVRNAAAAGWLEWQGVCPPMHRVTLERRGIWRRP